MFNSIFCLPRLGTIPSSTTFTLIFPGISCKTDILAIFSQDHRISEMKEAFKKSRQIPLFYMRKLRFGDKK